MNETDSAMNPHEEATVRAFIAPDRRVRWLEALASPKRRRRFLGRLNHCRDIDERYTTPLAGGADVVSLLRSRGAPANCYVVSDIADIDGREMPLAEAIFQAEWGGFGTLISCIPGSLAYYYDERGTTRRLLLQRPADSDDRAGSSTRKA